MPIPKEQYMKSRENDFIRQITHFICAKCGGDSTQSSNVVSQNITFFEPVAGVVQLNFTCPVCLETYCLALVNSINDNNSEQKAQQP